MNTVAGQSSISHRRLAGALLAAWCAGCTHYQAAPLAPQQNADQFAARRLETVPLREDLARLLPEAAAWPPRQWGRAELLAVALTQNPQLVVARAQVSSVQAREITAAENPNPDLTLQSEYARHDPHPWLYGVSLNWLLRSPQQRRLGIEIAALETSNARLELMDQAWSVRSALAASLTDWEQARRRLHLLDTLASAEDRLVTLERQRIDAGEDAPIELLSTEESRLQIEQERAEVRQAEALAQAAAAKALGVPPEALDGIAVSWSDWGSPPTLDEQARSALREQALLSRSDLGQAVGEYSGAEAKLRLSIARQYPEFTLSPGYYWDHGIAKFPFDLGFTLPLNGNRGEIAEARAERELAGRRMLAVQADIYGEIAGAERGEKIAAASAEAVARQLDTAKRQQQAADLGVKLGAADLQEQLSAEIVATRAELELVQAQARLQTSRNALEDALRTPVSGPELKLAQSMAIVAGVQR